LKFFEDHFTDLFQREDLEILAGIRGAVWKKVAFGVSLKYSRGPKMPLLLVVVALSETFALCTPVSYRYFILQQNSPRGAYIESVPGNCARLPH